MTAPPAPADARLGKALAKVMDRLDEQQRAVVRHMHGPALVVAGAGSGKTTVLTRRIAHMILSGVSPQSIMLLTFTREAAKVMTQRARGVCPDAAGINAGTFHSVATRLVRDNHRTFGLPSNFTVLNPADVTMVMRQILAPEKGGDELPQARTLAKIVSYATNTQTTVADVVLLHHPKHHRSMDLIVRLAERYADYKRERDLLDYDDLLTCFAVFAEGEATGAYARATWPHLMVDEHQDSNALQSRIIHAMAGDATGERSVMSVGDPSQSIYGFRGAVPSGMFGFQRRWDHTQVYMIETNYRSTPEIVACADEVDRSLRERFPRRLVAGKPSVGLRPALVSLPDRDHEADHVARAIVERRRAGTPYSEQAILVRSMRTGRAIEVALGRHDVPYKVKGGIKIHEAEQVQDVLAVLRVLGNPADEPSWMRILVLFRGVGEKGAAQVCGSFRRGTSLEDALAALDAMAARKPGFGDAAAVIRHASGARGPYAVMMSALEALEETFRLAYKDEWEWRRKDLIAVADLASSYDDVDEFVRSVTVDVSVDKVAERTGRPDEDGVLTLSTVHSSKGLEWDVVFLPSFVDGHIPSLQAAHAGEMDEERRLLYVAVTRARRELVITKPLVTQQGPRTVPAVPSAFEATIRRHLDAVVHRSAEPPRGVFQGDVVLSFR